MRKRFWLLLFLFSQQVPVFSQPGQDVIPKIIPPSPGAAALEKFSSIPVDYSTGVPSIAYPFWSWQRGKLQFNMGLSYHAGGHKIDDMPSPVGLGWALTGIGRISRTVRGIPDDNDVYGFMYTDSLPNLSTYSYQGDEYYYTYQTALNANQVVQYGDTHYGTIGNMLNNQVDGEQDLFSFSSGGSSGKFVIDKNKNIILLEYSNTKIEMVRNPITGLSADDGKIASFKITDDKGIVYKYERSEGNISHTYSSPVIFPPSPEYDYTAGWLLTKIIDPTTQDSIVIFYGDPGFNGGLYETGFSESMRYTINNESNNGIQLAGVRNSFQTAGTADMTPTEILFPDSSTINIQYQFEREDLVGCNALSKLKVKSYDNTVIKWLQLKYSYFESGDGTDFPAFAESDNDFSKRLRLDSIVEVSNDSTLFKPTVFTYNSTLLNARGSKNIDYWGYNVNPARNNTQYAPMVPLTGPEYGLAGLYYLDGADRSPDSVYSKAAILEKIKYPTGGFTSFEYESNKVYATFNYYVKQLQSNATDWDEDTFGETYTVDLSGRNDTVVVFHFSAEDDPFGTPQDNDPPVCFENGQDDKLARFIIKSTDNAYTDTVDCTYIQLMSAAGVSAMLNLPLNKVYQVKLLYDHEASCAFLYPFKAFATCTYYIVPQAKLAGGLRIKKIISNDGAGKVLTKSYEYNDANGLSSAVFADPSSIPNYGYYRVGVDETIGPAPTDSRKEINRTSNPTGTMGFNGSPLIYTRVIEKESDGSVTERYYDPVVWQNNGGEPGEYPYLPVQDFPNLSGMMVRQIIKDKTGTVKKTDSITYNKVISQLTNIGANRNLKAGMIGWAVDYPEKLYAADRYFMFTTRVEVIKDTTTVFENGNTITASTIKTYDPGIYYLRTSTSTNSRNEKLKESYNYSADGGSSVYSNMITKNMLHYVTQKTVCWPDFSNREVSKSLTTYQLWQSGILPMPGTVQSSISGNAVQTDITFNEYDAKGNIVQYTAKDGVITSFVWGYKKQYPVAKIIGKSYSDAISQSGLNLSVVNAPSSDAAMRTELNKLRSLSGCFVTTLTYKPLVGTTSETDANGRTIYYIYDAFNRLSLIRDKDNNILKKFCYNYTGQPVDCGQGSVAAWTAINSTCDTTSSGVFTGYMTVTEKDLNPASATYNQTRTVSVSNGLCIPTCIGEGKKTINDVCVQGVKVYSSSVRSGSVWNNTYYYIWLEDCSVSVEYSDVTSTRQLLLEPECP